MRHIVLKDAATLDEPAVKILMKHALERAGTTLKGKRGPVIIKSIVAKQRPRRPASN